MSALSIRKTLEYLETGRGKAQCRTTDRILNVVLWLHLPVALGLAFYFGKSSLWFAGLASVLIAAPATLLFRLQPGSLATRIVVGIGLMSFSALLVHLSGGLIEYHFHFFVFLAVMASYRDVRVLLTSTVFVAAHHVSFNFLLPYSLFNYGSNLGMVILHALFVVLEVAYLIVDIQLKSGEFDFVETTRSVVQRVTSAAQEVLGSNSDLARNAGQQAASVEEISATVVELDSQAQGTVQSVHTARSHLRTVGQEADQGMARVEQLVASMSALHEESSSMREMLSLIESIAFQTNLLSLNAAVEAARAGDSGRGFAVVAEEVRNLASRSGASAQQIGEVVESALRRVKEGNTAASETRGVFSKIHEGIASSEQQLVEVAEASEQVARSMGQISSALREIDQFTQETSAQAASGTDTAALLQEQAGELAGMLDGYATAEQNSGAARGTARGNGHGRTPTSPRDGAPAPRQRMPKALPERTTRA